MGDLTPIPTYEVIAIKNDFKILMQKTTKQGAFPAAIRPDLNQFIRIDVISAGHNRQRIIDLAPIQFPVTSICLRWMEIAISSFVEFFLSQCCWLCASLPTTEVAAGVPR